MFGIIFINYKITKSMKYQTQLICLIYKKEKKYIKKKKIVKPKYLISLIPFLQLISIKRKMLNGSVKSVVSAILFRFSTQGAGKKNYINIGRIIKKQQLVQQQKSKQQFSTSAKFFKRSKMNNSISEFAENNLDQNQIINQINSPEWKNQQFSSQKSSFTHMSTQEQQINHRIKSAIKSQTIYYECTKNKHKLQPRQYALMFCKMLEIRKINSKDRQKIQDYNNFLKIVHKKIDKMSPEDLIRIIHSIKYEGTSKNQLKLLMPIIQKIINEFSNQNNSQFDPKSFQTLRLSTNIKMIHSFLFLLEHTGSHFEKKLKQLMRQTLNYILFKSMRNKKYTKSGQYFHVSLKISFLNVCQSINASNGTIKNLILSILSQRQKLSLDNLLDIENIVFESTYLLQKARKQLFEQKNVHTQYNILYRIEKYIQDKIPSNLKKSSSYQFLNKKLVRHIQHLSKLTFDQLVLLQMSSHKDEQVSKILGFFHQAYKNYFIQNYFSLSDKQAIANCFHKSQKEYALYYLLNFFYSKLNEKGVNVFRPSINKQLKQFVNLLCKFFSQLNFLTQSAIIQILILSKFANLKALLIQYLNLNADTRYSQKKTQKIHFFARDKVLVMEKFFSMIKYEHVFRQNCSVQYEVFISSNIKNILKYIFKTSNTVNIQKYAFCLAQHCKNQEVKSLKSMVELVTKVYLKHSWDNRSFTKKDVDTIYNNKDQFLGTNLIQNSVQIQNQSDVFGKSLIQNELQQKQALLSTLEKDDEVFRDHYQLQNKLRCKLRRLFRNFKFVILFLQNVQLINSASKQIIDEDIYIALLQNFKTQFQCLKFQKLFTRQNLTQGAEIHEFLKEIWEKSLSKVEIRNQFLMYKNKMIKEKQIIKEEHNIDGKQIKSIQYVYQIKKQSESEQIKQLQKIVILEQEDYDESEQGEYSQQVQIFKGKDLIELESFKDFLRKQQKSKEYFKIKNRQFLQQFQLKTKDFTSFQASEDWQQSTSIIDLLRLLVKYYSSGSSNQVDSVKVIDLPSVDESQLQKSGLYQVFNIKFGTKQIKEYHKVRLYKNAYPTLLQLSAKKPLDSLNTPTIYYLNVTKHRKNLKRKEQTSPSNEQLGSDQNSKNSKSQMIN